MMKRGKGSLLNDTIIACLVALIASGAAFSASQLISGEEAAPGMRTVSAPILVEEGTDLFYVL